MRSWKNSLHLIELINYKKVDDKVFLWTTVKNTIGKFCKKKNLKSGI